MKKIFFKSVVIMTLIAIMLGMSMLLVGCKKEKPKDPVFEIKLYDYNWQEFNHNFGTYIDCVFEYDGKPKICNAIVYKDDEVFYKLDFNRNQYFYNDACLEVTKKDDVIGADVILSSTKYMPCKKGEYELNYQFDSKGYRNRINCFSDTPLPSKYFNYRVKALITIQ